MKNDNENVDRSRLRLLAGLTAAGASSACSSTADDPLGNVKTGLSRSETFVAGKKENEYKQVKPRAESMGGEGEGGGSH